MPEDNLGQFKKILTKLPEEKRKLLYNRLHALPASEREGFINDFVKKYNTSKKTPGKDASPSKAPAGKNVPDKSRGQPAKKGTAPSKGQQTSKGQAPVKGQAPAKGQHPSKGQSPAKGQAPVKGHVPSKGQPQAKGQAPVKGQTPAKGQPQAKGQPHAKTQAPVNGEHPKKPVQAQNNAPKKASPVQPEAARKPLPAKGNVQKPEVKQTQPRKIEQPRKEIAPKEIEPEYDEPDSEYEEFEEEEEEAVYTRGSTLQSVAIGLLAALLIVGVGYIIYAFNKQAIDRKFNQMFGMPAEVTINTSQDDPGIEGPEPQHYPTETPTPIPATPTPTPVPLKSDHPDLKGKTIVIDPGHQAVANTELETVIEKTSAEKEKGTTGAVGINTGAKEYEVTLRYALVLKEYLEGCGAKVILTRDSDDADISNIERAKIATDNNADYFIRLHADSAPDAKISGVKVYVPATGKYSKTAAKDGKKLADIVAEGIGSTSLGSVQSKMYTGLNHADSVKSYQLVIGYLSNSTDDALIANDETPYKVAVAVSEFLGK